MIAEKLPNPFLMVFKTSLKRLDKNEDARATKKYAAVITSPIHCLCFRRIGVKWYDRREIA